MAAILSRVKWVKMHACWLHAYLRHYWNLGLRERGLTRGQADLFAMQHAIYQLSSNIPVTTAGMIARITPSNKSEVISIKLHSFRNHLIRGKSIIFSSWSMLLWYDLKVKRNGDLLAAWNDEIAITYLCLKELRPNQACAYYQMGKTVVCTYAGNSGKRFLHHRLQRKPLVSDSGMHHGTCLTHMRWYMSGSLTRGDGENVPGIPGACATRNFTFVARDQLIVLSSRTFAQINTATSRVDLYWSQCSGWVR